MTESVLRSRWALSESPQLHFLSVLIPVSGEQVWNPCSLPSWVLTQSQPALASASVSYDTGGSAAFGEP